MTAVRRSGRSRKPAESVYDEAMTAALARLQRKKEEAAAAAAELAAAREAGADGSSTDEDKNDEEMGHETEEESPREDDEDDQDEDDSSSDDSNFETPAKSKSKSKSPARKKARLSSTTTKKGKSSQPQKKKQGKKKVQIKVKSGGGPARKAAPKRKKAPDGAGPRRAINSALASLAKKVLEHFEVPETSLVAGLLLSYRPYSNSPSLSSSSSSRGGREAQLSQPGGTVYTPQLTALARATISLHNTDPNAAQINLLNLLFRSVGGTPDTNLDPTLEDGMTLEEMDNDDWARAVTDLVDEMRHTPADRILLCADPDGAVHASAVLERGEKDAPAPTHGSLGVREYRRIYEEFWYVLGGVALSEGGMASNAAQAEVEDDIEDEDSSDDDEDSDDDDAGAGRKRKTPAKKSKKSKKAKKSPKRATFTTTIRFDAELVKDLINRVVELVSVGQPDVRAAATIAAYQMGRAILDKTVLLDAKLEVARRQYDAAVKRSSPAKSKSPASKSPLAALGRKAESLKHQIDSLRRTREDLEEAVLGPVVQGVFVHRYRDSDMHIRTASIRALSGMMIQRPDHFLMDKYLKYLGWMMSDKAECVRCAALEGLAAPFDVVHGTGPVPGTTRGIAAVPVDSVDKIDLKLLENVSVKFLPRLADCVVDVSVKVQERAMRLLLALLRDGFLDEAEDENIWNQINLRALARDASPSTRRDALYFVMEQLEAFDDADDEDEDDEEGASEEEEGEGKVPASASKAAAKGKKSSGTGANAGGGAAASASDPERRTVQRLDALASWTAHALTDGPIPLDQIRIDLADLVVLSLRDMPEHKHLVTDWSALARAISDDRAATTMQGTTAGDRGDVAKQRVLVQMLASAARAEVGTVTDASFLRGDIDPDVIAHQSSEAGGSNGEGEKPGVGRGGHHKRASTAIQHESLSVALLKALPDLLIKFKTDSAVLRSLTILPRYLLATVFSLPQRKADFAHLSKNLAEIYLNSTDEKVLQNAALSLFYLTEGDHARAPDAALVLREVVMELQGRLVELFSEDVGALMRKKGKGAGGKGDDGDDDERSRSSSGSKGGEKDEDGKDAPSEAEETEYALYLNLKRLRVLSKRCDCAKFFGGDEDSANDGSDGDGNDGALEGLSSVIADGVNARLKAWKVERGGSSNKGDDDMDEDEDDKSTRSKSPASPWDCGHEDVSSIVAGSVTEGLTVLLSLTAWKLLAVQRDHSLVIREDDMEDVSDDKRAGGSADEDEDEDVSDHLVLRMRKRIVALLISCYDQFLDRNGRGGGRAKFSTEQIAFADAVQDSAGKVTSDLRMLCPKEWGNAASPLLRAFAMQDEPLLLTGYVRYLRSNEAPLKANHTKEKDSSDVVKDEYAEKDTVTKFLLPIGRALAYNWTNGNRREAGVVLAHLTGSGKESHDLVTALSRIFKKVEPVRLLEAQMAALRSGYENWLDNEPDEVESEHPTDAEMAAFEEQERAHGEMFGQLETLASKFSQSLGVGKLSSDRLPPALLGFMREGIKGAFHSDEEWALGSRLSFLNVLSKYSIWLKKNAEHLRVVEQDLDERERELREHEEFPDVHVDDIACLESFRAGLGLKPSLATQPQQDANIIEEDTLMTPGTQRSELMTPATQRSRRSMRSMASRTASEYAGSQYTTPATQRSTRSAASAMSAQSDLSAMTPATYLNARTPGTQMSALTPATQRTSRSAARSTMSGMSASSRGRSDYETPGTQRSTRSTMSRFSRASSTRSNLSPLYENTPGAGTTAGASTVAESSRAGSPSDHSEGISRAGTESRAGGSPSDYSEGVSRAGTESRAGGSPSDYSEGTSRAGAESRAGGSPSEYSEGMSRAGTESRAGGSPSDYSEGMSRAGTESRAGGSPSDHSEGMSRAGVESRAGGSPSDYSEGMSRAGVESRAGGSPSDHSEGMTPASARGPATQATQKTVYGEGENQDGSEGSFDEEEESRYSDVELR